MNEAVIDSSAQAQESPKSGGKKRFTYNPNRVAHNLNKLGLGYFSPFARLIGKDEPAKQVREIANNTILPLLAFSVFIGIWAITARLVKTDSVQIPTPHQSWYALTGAAIPGLPHPFPESIEGMEAPYFEENDGLDPKSINGFSAAEQLSEQKFRESQQERVDKYLDRANEAEAEGDSAKAEKYRANAEMFASKTYQTNKTFYDQIWISLLTILIGFPSQHWWLCLSEFSVEFPRSSTRR